MNKFQYSKILPILSLIVLIWCLWTGFNTDFSTVIDVSFYVTAVTVVGSLTVTSWVWYLKKSQAENTFKIKLGLYKEIARVRVHYAETMAEVKASYGDYPVMPLDESPFEQMENEAMYDLNSSVDMAMADATEMIREEHCDG